jgi:hypothetical protein
MMMLLIFLLRVYTVYTNCRYFTTEVEISPDIFDERLYSDCAQEEMAATPAGISVAQPIYPAEAFSVIPSSHSGGYYLTNQALEYDSVLQSCQLDHPSSFLEPTRDYFSPGTGPNAIHAPAISSNREMTVMIGDSFSEDSLYSITTPFLSFDSGDMAQQQDGEDEGEVIDIPVPKRYKRSKTDDASSRRIKRMNNVNYRIQVKVLHVPSNDVRRYYTTMWSNVFNQYDYKLLLQFIERYSRPDFLLKKTFPRGGEDALKFPSATILQGRESAALYWAALMQYSPDQVVKHDQVRTTNVEILKLCTNCYFCVAYI